MYSHFDASKENIYILFLHNDFDFPKLNPRRGGGKLNFTEMKWL